MSRAGMTGSNVHRRVSALGTITLLLAGAFGAEAVAAQHTVFGAEVRPRFEFRDVDGAGNTAFTSMRTRFQVARELSGNARIFVQFQDVRLWGDEVSVADGSADQFDAHQAYLELGHHGESPLWIRAGRQEAEYAEGRLVGMPVWSQVGNAYDGVRAGVKLGDFGVVDLFGFQIREAASARHDRDDTFYGAWAEFPIGDRSLQLFALHDRLGVVSGTERTTLGGYYLASTGAITYRVEGALQRGDLMGRELSANMVAARVTLPLLQGRGDVTLWYDRYSGDAEAAARDGVPTGAFHDLFGRNHRFFGFADLFANIPADTQGRGIQDLALRFGWGVFENGQLGLDLHRFMVTDDAGMTEGALADEIDLTLTVPALSGVDLLGGIAWVSSAEGGRTLGIVPNDQFFLYLQLTAGF